MGLILVNQNYLLFYTAVISHFDIYEEQHNSFFRCFMCVNRIHKNLYLFIISSLLPRQKVDYLYLNSY